MAEPQDVLRQYRAGELSAEAAAELLLPVLKAAGKLELEVTESDMPLLEALQQLARPSLPPAQPLTWESKSWNALEALPDSFWPQIQLHGLEKIPQCLNCLFLVGSNLAVDLVTRQLETGTDIAVTTELPSDYGKSSGRVFGRTPAKLLNYQDLVDWAGWIRGFTPVPDATLDELFVSGPPKGE